MRVLILGGNGMLGSMLSSVLSNNKQFNVEQTVRSDTSLHLVNPSCVTHVVNVLDKNAMRALFIKSAPEVVINCIGVIKQRPEAQNFLDIFPINALLPHWLAEVGQCLGFRLIHFSTDCVFSGSKGMYSDNSACDVTDYYGQSKYLGETRGYDNALTLRTSIIGHETNSEIALIDWFLTQKGAISGFKNAIFSGFPTAEIGKILVDHILNQPELNGVYNVSANPISKYDLLHLVKDTYDKDIMIEAEHTVKVDRSLDSENFRAVTGYTPPSWPDLVQLMYDTRPNFKST